MRLAVCFALLLPCPAMAEAISADSRIVEVTIYPYGAEVTREVIFDVPAGQHDLTVEGLPEVVLDSHALRITAGGGASVGAYALVNRSDPLAEPRRSSLQQAAWARMKALEAEERTLLGRLGEIDARIAAADAKAGFLAGLGNGQTELGSASAESLQGIADMIGDQVLIVRQQALEAQAERLEVEAQIAELQERLARARDAYAAIATPDATQPVLDMAVTTAAAGRATLRLTYIVGQASWSPVYDITLDRKGGSIGIERGVTIFQETGEDWTDVRLTLSTAQLDRQSAPATLWPEYRRIDPEQSPSDLARTQSGNTGGVMAEADMAPESPAVVASAPSPVAAFVGDTVVYRYEPLVDVASGTQSLRLVLDRQDFAAKAEAVAVPRVDAVAYLKATFTNTGDEILLPGVAFLYRDGALVTTTQLSALPAGVEMDLSFGAIDGLQLTREMPMRSEGERGILTTTNRFEESAILKVENRTGEDWPVRLIDQVPYSEQEDLEITWTANPAPSETDVDGQRGILSWVFDLPAGQSQEVALDHTITWPEGMVLQ